ncbi:MAG TPA: dihydrofolate reductase [Xanthobacteraceae bacterium]|jgi:dihydrofolate reductase|nr:dihydrofolate reductase [Xanthobacteraceae bacterium]
MVGALRTEGFAIVASDGMLADRAGHMPDALKIEADQRFFATSLDRVEAVVHGRHSHEGQPNSPRRRRLIVTRRISGIEADPDNPMARLWNPAGASFSAACAALGVERGTVAVIGGTDVFGLFLDIGYDAFHLSRANKVRLPGGRPVFPQVPAQTPEAVLADHGLSAGERRVLDAQADASLVTWIRSAT